MDGIIGSYSNLLLELIKFKKCKIYTLPSGGFFTSQVYRFIKFIKQIVNNILLIIKTIPIPQRRYSPSDGYFLN